MRLLRVVRSRTVAALFDLVVLVLGAVERLEQRWQARHGQAPGGALRVSTADGEKTLKLRTPDHGGSRDERSHSS